MQIPKTIVITQNNLFLKRWTFLFLVLNKNFLEKLDFRPKIIFGANAIAGGFINTRAGLTPRQRKAATARAATLPSFISMGVNFFKRCIIFHGFPGR